MRKRLTAAFLALAGGLAVVLAVAPSALARGGSGSSGFGGGGFGGGGRELLQANQAAITDLSKLGKPGTHFVQDFFLPGTQLTFPQFEPGAPRTLLVRGTAASPGAAVGRAAFDPAPAVAWAEHWPSNARERAPR